MKSLAVMEDKSLKIVEVPKPVVENTSMIVKVLACGVYTASTKGTITADMLLTIRKNIRIRIPNNILRALHYQKLYLKLRAICHLCTNRLR